MTSDEKRAAEIAQSMGERLRHAIDLPTMDRESIAVLIAAGEWGVALETLCTELYEYDLAPNAEERAQRGCDRPGPACGASWGTPGSVAEAAGGNWITHLATSALGYGGTDRVTAVRTGFAPRCGQRHPGWFIRVTTFPRFAT